MCIWVFLVVHAILYCIGRGWRERERGREGEGGREGEREKGREGGGRPTLWKADVPNTWRTLTVTRKCLLTLTLVTRCHCCCHLGCTTRKVTESLFHLRFPWAQDWVRRRILSCGAYVLVKLHGVLPTEINNWRENHTEVRLSAGPMIALHVKAFIPKKYLPGLPMYLSPQTQELLLSHIEVFPWEPVPVVFPSSPRAGYTQIPLYTSGESSLSGWHAHLSWRDAFDGSEDSVFSWILLIAYSCFWVWEYFLCPYSHCKSRGHAFSYKLYSAHH